MQIIVFDTSLTLRKLYPMSITRPVCDIRHGLFTLREWYGMYANMPVHAISAEYFPAESDQFKVGPYLCMDSSVIPDDELMKKLLSLEPGISIEDANGIIAYVSEAPPAFDRFPLFFRETIHAEKVARINHPIDWVKTNMQKLASDFKLLDQSLLQIVSADANRIFGDYPVWMDNGAKATGVFFNTEDGPVYLGKNALVMEGACIRGPVAILEGSMVKMGAQIYQGTTIGKFSVAGGEIKNSILGDYSNKAHHGYLGDSMIGRWCNLGAGTTNSNVKNNAGEVKMWSGEMKKEVPAGKKAGMVMGDFSKTAINTGINTGTTIGACCSIHKPGFPQKHIPSFSWGPGENYDLHKALDDLENWFQFKKQPMEAGLPSILEHLWQICKPS